MDRGRVGGRPAQVNDGQTAWYGEACSGPLPAQYNYSGVSDLENTATNVAQTLENAYYIALSHTIAPELSQPVTVSGHPGWEIEYLVNYTNATAQGATWTTEEGAVLVADTGTGNTPVVFFTSVPDTLGETNVGSLVSSLQLTVVPNAAGGSPGADAGDGPGGERGAVGRAGVAGEARDRSKESSCVAPAAVRPMSWRRPPLLLLSVPLGGLRRYWGYLAALFAGKYTQSAEGNAVLAVVFRRAPSRRGRAERGAGRGQL